MPVNFPNSPTNGQTVTVDGVTYSWNAAGSVWDMVTTATATVAVTAPVVNTGTSTAAVLGIQNNPTLNSPTFVGNGGSGTSSASLQVTGGASNQLANLQFRSTFGNFPQDTGPRRTADIWAWFNGGAWTTETLSFGVGTGGGNDGGTLTTERMRITSAGHVTKPAQPFFYARGGESNWVSTAQGDAPFSIAVHNRGTVFNTSNYRFTAPIAGVYSINFSLFANGGTDTRLAIKVNGAAYNSSQNTYTPSGFTTWSGNMYLNANDYVTVGDWQNYTNAAVYMGHSHFSGYLLG
jgi:hypothetical protein